MNVSSSLKRWWRAGAGLALVTATVFAVSGARGLSADAPADKTDALADKTADKNTEAKAEKKAVAKPTKKKLTGQELYAINCNRCHAERYPTEWTSAQWKTLLLHMRVRANLPAKPAKEILKYLQEDAGN